MAVFNISKSKGQKKRICFVFFIWFESIETETRCEKLHDKEEARFYI